MRPKKKTGNLFINGSPSKTLPCSSAGWGNCREPILISLLVCLKAMDWQICFLVSALSRTSSSQFWSRPCLPLHPAQITLTGNTFINVHMRHQCTCPLYCRSDCIPVGLENNYMGYLEEPNVIVISNINQTAHGICKEACF